MIPLRPSLVYANSCPGVSLVVFGVYSAGGKNISDVAVGSGGLFSSTAGITAAAAAPAAVVSLPPPRRPASAPAWATGRLQHQDHDKSAPTTRSPSTPVPTSATAVPGAAGASGESAMSSSAAANTREVAAVAATVAGGACSAYAERPLDSSSTQQEAPSHQSSSAADVENWSKRRRVGADGAAGTRSSSSGGRMLPAGNTTLCASNTSQCDGKEVDVTTTTATAAAADTSPDVSGAQGNAAEVAAWVAGTAHEAGGGGDIHHHFDNEDSNSSGVKRRSRSNSLSMITCFGLDGEDQDHAPPFDLGDAGPDAFFHLGSKTDIAMAATAEAKAETTREDMTGERLLGETP